MRPIKKPGPKSKTRIASQQKKLVVPDLGDTDTDTSESFQSPPPDENVTDYNLDFTNRTPQITEARRKSPRRPFPTSSAAVVLPTTASTSRNIRNSNSLASTRVTAAEVVAPPHKKRRKQIFPQRRELRRILSSTQFMIARAPFARVVREIMQREGRGEVHMITKDALVAIQTATEMYIENRFQDSYLVTLHTGRKTLMVRDMELVNFLQARFNQVPVLELRIFASSISPITLFGIFV